MAIGALGWEGLEPNRSSFARVWCPEPINAGVRGCSSSPARAATLSAFVERTFSAGNTLSSDGRPPSRGALRPDPRPTTSRGALRPIHVPLDPTPHEQPCPPAAQLAARARHNPRTLDAAEAPRRPRPRVPRGRHRRPGGTLVDGALPERGPGPSHGPAPGGDGQFLITSERITELFLNRKRSGS